MTGQHESATDGVWAVVTMFRARAVPPLIRQLAPQVEGIIVVDDGSGEEFARVLEEVARLDAHVIASSENAGIGAALNLGLHHARAVGAKAIVTFDQDSTIDPGFVAALAGAHRQALVDGAGGGPVVPEFFAGVRQAAPHVIGSTTLAAHAIQSGMYIPVEVLDRVGMMDESLFIDLVDVDFELRCQDAGMRCIVARGIRLEHRLGARYRVPGRLGTVLPSLTLSAPFRYYYRARNRIIINRRHRLHWARLAREGLADHAYFLIVIVLARPRSAMRRVIRAGRAAGRRHETGRMPIEMQTLASRVRWQAVLQED